MSSATFFSDENNLQKWMGFILTLAYNPKLFQKTLNDTAHADKEIFITIKKPLKLIQPCIRLIIVSLYFIKFKEMKPSDLNI